MSETAKKKWSKKKKIIVITLSIIAFLLVATVCAGLGVLHWYCTTPTFEIISSEGIATKDTKIIAHRGFRAVAPENTAPAFQEAGENKFWGAECDIYRTKDGVWVIQHDVNTYRMMDFTKSIEKCTYDELKSHKTDNGVNIDKYPNLSITTLDEYLEICEKYNMTAVIELKGRNNTEHYDEIVKSINSHKCNVVFISFHSENLEKMRKLTDVPMFFLTQKVSEEDIETAKSIENCGIDFNGNKEKNFENDAEIIKKCRDAGLEIGAWTIDNKEVMQKLLDLGIEYITTDNITY